MKAALISSLLLTAGICRGQDSPDARAILDRVAQAGPPGRTYRAEFSGSLENSGTGLQQKIALSGNVLFQPPNKLRMEMTMGPTDMLMVRNGAEGWIYYPAIKQYVKIP